MKFLYRKKRYVNHVKASITERLAQFLQREREREMARYISKVRVQYTDLSGK
jgi:hypothetical protein